MIQIAIHIQFQYIARSVVGTFGSILKPIDAMSSESINASMVHTSLSVST